MVNKKYHGKKSTYEQQVEQHMADSATLRSRVKTSGWDKEAGGGKRDRVARLNMDFANIFWREYLAGIYNLLRNVAGQVKNPPHQRW